MTKLVKPAVPLAYPLLMACPWIPLLLVVLTSAAAGQEPTIPLCNGEDLSGWSGDPAYWSVEDGCIVGRTTAENPLPRSIYLFSEVEAEDFVLEFDYRIDGGNSGVQYRSERLAEDDVAGYQADIEDGPNYSGILYESAGRAIMAQRGMRVQYLGDGSRLSGQELGDAAQLQAAIHDGEWNHYRIVAKGPRLAHEINGVRMVEVSDEDNQRARSGGLFALQLHQGPPMEVRFKNLQLRRLLAHEDAGLEAIPQMATASPQTRPAEWIWSTRSSSDQEKQWFHLAFDLEQPAMLSSGLITCDNGFTAWIDGQQIAEGSAWWAPSTVTSGMRLAAGRHDFAITAWNEGGPAGLVASLELLGEDGETRILKTDQDWRSTPKEPEGWPHVAPSITAGDSWTPVYSLGEVGASGLVWGQIMAPRRATPVDHFLLPDDFKASLVHNASTAEGSWASMTFGPDGEIYVSPERGQLLRFTFPQGYDEAPDVQRLDTPVHSAQGLLFAYGGLYANVAGGIGEEGDGGLHRIRDLDGDGVFEDHAHLAKYGPPSEHGAHGIALGPEGLLYVVLGNHTKLPENLAATSSYRDYAEDVLLPRIWDPRGHAHGMFAPAAVVMRTNPNASSWELVAGGMRNPYDLAFSPDGELFTYDADMEWDIGTPWYRSPLLLHVVPGGEYGWRSGSAKWPSAYPDALPPVLETGPASPVGITFGTGSAFPAPWSDRLFLADWAYGRITAVDLEAHGASFQGTAFDFLSGKPLNVTDLEFGPDGALWFTTGGRGTQSGLYRVEYTGAAVQASPSFARQPSEAALMRRRLEQQKTTLEQTMRMLGSPDRALRYAARWDLERRPTTKWKHQLQQGQPSLAFGEILLAAARVGDVDMRAEARRRLLEWDFAADQPEFAWLQLRAAMLLRMRSGEQEQVSADPELASYFGQAFPTRDSALNREIARLLVAVEAPGLPALLMEQLGTAVYQEEQLHYALLLRLVASDWSDLQRLVYLRWLRKSHGMAGGMSLSGFLDAMEADALSNLDAPDREALLADLPPRQTSADPTPATHRDFQRAWTVTEGLAALDALASDSLDQEDLATGKTLFRDLLCIQCHRWDGEGGNLGPDLSAVGHRFGRRDLLEALIEPQKAVSDQFPLVPMPLGLLDTATAEEVAALIRFLEEGPGGD